MWDGVIRYEGCTSSSIKQKLEENRVKKLAVQLDLQGIVQNKQTSNTVLSRGKSKICPIQQNTHIKQHTLSRKDTNKKVHIKPTRRLPLRMGGK